ncbi:hypothetical protein BJX64DRAFT_275689 [Aspergillus heterothallicus]
MDPTLSHVCSVWAAQRSNSPIYNLLVGNVTITSATPGAIQARLTVKKLHTNSKCGLHGTLTACIVDWAAGMAIASHGGSTTGVSTDVHISYLASAAEGTLPFLFVEIKTTKEDGAVVVIVTGSHTKYVKATP